jgi:hypothetical protein
MTNTDDLAAAWRKAGLSTRTAYLVASQGISTLDELRGIPPAVLLRIEGLGRARLSEIDVLVGRPASYPELLSRGEGRPGKLSLPGKAGARLARGNIDLRRWTLAAVDSLKENIETTILAAATEAIRHAAQDRAFGILSHDEDRRDPLTACLIIALGDEDHDPEWEFSVGELIDDMIEGERFPATGKIHIEPRNAYVLRVRDRLRELAQRIDDAIAPEQQS